MEKIKDNLLLASYTTFKIGGPAKYFAQAESIAEIQEFCSFAKQNDLPIFVLGGGSNVLISDKGFGGLAIKIQDTRYKIQNNKIFASAGISLAKLVSESTKVGLFGLEWAAGIPGTVGGAIHGNAGAFGQSISDSIKSVKVLNFKDLSTSDVDKKFCGFKYRDSVFSAKGGKSNSNFIILEAEFILKKDSPENIKERIKNNLAQRQNSYSFRQKSARRQAGCAGSFFKNIEWSRLCNGFGGQAQKENKEEWIKEFPELKRFENKPKIAVGFLIEFLGLKGQKIGGAAVSKEHANFILNTGNATAEQVIVLMNFIKERVYSRYGFNLEEEVQLVGFEQF